MHYPKQGCSKVLIQYPCKSASHLSHVLALVLRPTEVNLIPHQPTQTSPAPERPLTAAFLDRAVSAYGPTPLRGDLKSHRCPFSLHVSSPVMDQTFWWMWSACQKIADHPREICSAEPTTSDPGSPSEARGRFIVVNTRQELGVFSTTPCLRWCCKTPDFTLTWCLIHMWFIENGKTWILIRLVCFLIWGLYDIYFSI